MNQERERRTGPVLAALAAASLLVVMPRPAAAEISNCAPDARQASGAEYRICMPQAGRWNGDLVLYAHGYVAFNEPLEIPEDQLTLPDGTSIPQIINGLGFAFATTSYSRNGLAVLEGIDDLRDLVSIFAQEVAAPTRVFIVGPSEGGIVTALAIEQDADLYDGGVAACGPIGDFARQINYIGDFRVVFDVYFPGVLPGSAVNVPDELIQNFETVYEPRIREAIAAFPDRALEVLRVTRAPGAGDPANLEKTFTGVLWYAVFATNDAAAQFGGQPFDNRTRFYTGSSNDLLLNLLVERADADPAALEAIRTGYTTSGLLLRPIVTVHTLGDQIIPYGHEPLYRGKVVSTGSTVHHANIPISRYGHCNFTAAEMVVAFAVMLQKAGASGLSADAVARALSTAEARVQFADLSRRLRLR